ncbi:MAG: ATP-binding cassette domain-containing protein, partial [Treponema sp.]|nr:ATP-binding cassette domain-containing protein [Treponema sp.]
MLKVTNVHKAFGSNKILKGVDLEVKKGDVVVILGPSGSGKTTFLRCLDFMESADQGEMEFGAIKTSLRHAHKKTILDVRRKTGFVFQNFNLFNNKTALENVMEGLVTARKIPKAKAEEIAERALQKVGLLDRKDFYPSQLSGGQQQRVGIARAIAPNPDVVFF